MMPFFCYNKNDYCDHSDNCDGCNVWVHGKGGKEVPTNADRIRAMSDKELAKLICKHKPMHSWPEGVQKIYYSTRMTGVEAWTQWLQEPAKED